MGPKADLLIVTVTEVESVAVMDAFEEATGRKAAPVRLGRRVYDDLGELNGTRVFMALSEMGAGGLGGSQQTVAKGIEALSPAAVILVGIAFGVDEEKQAIGDVLVSQQLWPYELQRVGVGQIIPRDDKPHASSSLINHLASARNHMIRSAMSAYRVWFGLILTGAKLVDDVDYRDGLRRLEPEAIGGEMEGGGLYVAAQDQKVDWIVVKAICDWADGHKGQEKAARQDLAAHNAARFVVYALQHVPLHEPPGAAVLESGQGSEQSSETNAEAEGWKNRFEDLRVAEEQRKKAHARNSLSRKLKALAPDRFADLKSKLPPQARSIASRSTRKSDQVEALLEWANGPGGCGLETLASLLEDARRRP